MKQRQTRPVETRLGEVSFVTLSNIQFTLNEHISSAVLHPLLLKVVLTYFSVKIYYPLLVTYYMTITAYLPQTTSSGAITETQTK